MLIRVLLTLVIILIIVSMISEDIEDAARVRQEHQSLFEKARKVNSVSRMLITIIILVTIIVLVWTL